ncbi:MAG TPA: hypothetical protein VE621_09990, partial [Bryobacteraceae bacterium]|nr:hypothetical protein [Bryobacteraceae bacterium]
DSWAVVFSLVAGYDPYGSVGGLAKLAMATGPSGLASQFEDQPAEVANRSLNERLSGVFDLLKTVCASDAAKNACSTYRSVMHPNMPDATPLLKPGVKAVTRDPKVRKERDPAAATGSVLQ